VGELTYHASTAAFSVSMAAFSCVRLGARKEKYHFLGSERPRGPLPFLVEKNRAVTVRIHFMCC